LRGVTNENDLPEALRERMDIAPVYMTATEVDRRKKMSPYQRAVEAYWKAETPEEQRTAYAELRRVGMPASYGESDSFMHLIIDRIWCVMKRDGLVT
jgi:hypothetical protein